MGPLATFLLSTLPLGGLLAGLAIVLIVAERVLVNYGICRIDVNSGEQAFEVEGGQTLLSALQGAGVRVPAACGGKGSCGYCKVTVAAGGGQVLPTERPFLSRAEVRKGVRLACQVKIRNDIGITVPDFLETIRQMVRDRTYNPNLRWRWQVVSPPHPAREGPAEAPVLDRQHDTAEDVAFIESILNRHEGRDGASVPVLQAVNAHYGYLPADVLRRASAGLDVPLSQLHSLATFYNAFSLTPKGMCTIKVCLGTACHVKGATRIIQRLERELGIEEGETTPDHAFTLEAVRCLGCCGLAPVLTFDEEVHGRAKPAQMPKLLKAKRAEIEEAAAVGST